MAEPPYTDNANGDSNYRWIQVSFGILLLTMGIVGVMWLIYSVANLTVSPQNVQVLAKFMSFDENASIKIPSDGNIQFPDGVFYTVGFLLYVGVLGLAGGLTKVLLTTGARLLAPDIGPLLSRLREVRVFKEYGSNRIR